MALVIPAILDLLCWMPIGCRRAIRWPFWPGVLQQCYYWRQQLPYRGACPFARPGWQGALFVPWKYTRCTYAKMPWILDVLLLFFFCMLPSRAACPFVVVAGFPPALLSFALPLVIMLQPEYI